MKNSNSSNDEANYWKNNGNVLFLDNNFEDALKSYVKAIEINPNYSDAWNNLALTYFKLGRVKDAHSCLKKLKDLQENTLTPKIGLTPSKKFKGNKIQPIYSYFKKKRSPGRIAGPIAVLAVIFLIIGSIFSVDSVLATVAIVGILLAFASYYLYVTNIFEISETGYKLLASLMISIPFFPIFFFYYEPVYAILTSVITTTIAYCILWGIVHFKWIFTKGPVTNSPPSSLYVICGILLVTFMFTSSIIPFSQIFSGTSSLLIYSEGNQSTPAKTSIAPSTSTDTPYQNPPITTIVSRVLSEPIRSSFTQNGIQSSNNNILAAPSSPDPIASLPHISFGSGTILTAQPTPDPLASLPHFPNTPPMTIPTVQSTSDPLAAFPHSPMGPMTIPTAQPTPDPFASLPHSPSGLSMSSQPIQMQVPVTPIQQIQIPPQIQVPINQPPQIIQQPPQIIRPPQPIIQPPPMIAPPVSQGFHQGFH